MHSFLSSLRRRKVAKPSIVRSCAVLVQARYDEGSAKRWSLLIQPQTPLRQTRPGLSEDCGPRGITQHSYYNLQLTREPLRRPRAGVIGQQQAELREMIDAPTGIESEHRRSRNGIGHKQGRRVTEQGVGERVCGRTAFLAGAWSSCREVQSHIAGIDWLSEADG